MTREITALLPNPLPVSKPDVMLATLYMERHPSLPTRDAVHLGSMRANRIERIVSADRHFESIEDVSRIDPSAF